MRLDSRPNCERIRPNLSHEAGLKKVRLIRAESRVDASLHAHSPRSPNDGVENVKVAALATVGAGAGFV